MINQWWWSDTHSLLLIGWGWQQDLGEDLQMSEPKTMEKHIEAEQMWSLKQLQRHIIGCICFTFAFWGRSALLPVCKEWAVERLRVRAAVGARSGQEPDIVHSPEKHLWNLWWRVSEPLGGNRECLECGHLPEDLNSTETEQRPMHSWELEMEWACLLSLSINALSFLAKIA